jgi:hypothetical protein
MPENPNQPRENDAVLGGDSPPPINAVVLGGLEGVKKRFASTVESQKIQKRVLLQPQKRVCCIYIICSSGRGCNAV